jgi:DedD protein
MARASISDEELLLKKRARRRLVGAIALVLIVVVFLPMLLDGEPKPLTEDISINIPPVPPADQAPGLSAPTPNGKRPAALQEPEGSETPASPPAESPAQSASNAATAGALATLASPASEAVTQESYVVQLGAFSSPAKARQLVAKLKENRFRAYTQTIKTAGGELTRVRVGSYPSREAAEKARTQLKTRKLVIGEATVVRNDI